MLNHRRGVARAADSQATDNITDLRDGLSLGIVEEGGVYALIQVMGIHYEGRKSGKTERSQDAGIQLGGIPEGVKREGYVPANRVVMEGLHEPLTSWTRSRGDVL